MTTIIWPDDLDDEIDRAYLASLIESSPAPCETALVGGVVTVAWWTTESGDRRWTAYRSTGQPSLTEILGYMELAQHHLIQHFGYMGDIDKDDS